MEIAAPTASHSMSATADVQSKATSRLFFVDNIRVLLTILVVLFHVMIIYAGTGSWYYTEGREDFITGALGAWFITVTQAYFMGLFLLISAYFVPGSYDRKGAGRFLKDRLIRLGIPLVVYSWIIRPVLVYADPIRWQGPLPPFWDYFPVQYFQHNALFGAGPLWFIETLLIFSLVYVLWRLLFRPRPPTPAVETEGGFPNNFAIALFALLLGLAGFLVRLWHPIMWSFEPLNLQFPFFAQYIALFVVGLIAYRRNWLLGLPGTTGRVWLVIAVITILLYWPLMLGGGAATAGLDAFIGGWHWQAFAYDLWESFLCVGMCIGLIYLFRRHLNHQRPLVRFLSLNAYTAYLIHGPVITALAYAARDVALYPLLKWGLVSLVAVPLCFGLSALIRKLPYTDRVL
jgi:surface polysaccharide O-acyltransferase-like enzyme